MEGGVRSPLPPAKKGTPVLGKHHDTVGGAAGGSTEESIDKMLSLHYEMRDIREAKGGGGSTVESELQKQSSYHIVDS